MKLLDTRPARVLHSFDGAYLERLRAGDGETVRHFVAYFSELILIKLRARIWSRTLIEDVRQETFLRVFRALRSRAGVRQPERLGAFVNSVCNHVVLELFRSQRRHGPAGEPPDAPDGVANPENQMATEELRTLVRCVLDELPARDRGVLRALFLEEREKDEVCAQLGVGRDYLRVLLHRAKASFRAHLRERHPLPADSALPTERWLP